MIFFKLELSRLMCAHKYSSISASAETGAARQTQIEEQKANEYIYVARDRAWVSLDDYII